jgi:hypothetical protein
MSEPKLQSKLEVNIIERIHVVPLSDTREHEVSINCWCSPEYDEEFDQVLHNAADGREDFEEGKRKPS